MKNVTFNISLSVLMLFIILSCDNDGDNFLSPDDKIAMEGMQTAFENAVIQNAAFRSSYESNDSLVMHMHDSLFHYHVDLYFEHHGNYTHESYHDDHHHDNHGMHMSNTVYAKHHNWSDGHHQEDHEQMEDLLGDHDELDHDTNEHHNDSGHMGNH